MTLSRIVLLLTVVVSTGAYAADQKQQPTTADSSWSAPFESLHLVPWFTGMKHGKKDLKPAPRLGSSEVVLLPNGVMKESSCLKLRTYKVRRQETLSDGESAFVSYSTCQWATNYQVRSAVQIIQEPSH